MSAPAATRIASGSAPTRRRAIDGLTAALESAGKESARLEAERLVAHVVGLTRAELALSLDATLSPREVEALADASERRCSGEPLQYIEGSVDFRELTLRVDGRALIPRPETEQLVELTRRWADRRGRPVPRALDIGTGSGAIALSLAREEIAGQVVALEVSSAALSLAAENRRRLGLKERVELRRVETTMWSAVPAGEQFDLVVANPPYVRSGEMRALAPELAREPRIALDGGPDGLSVIREICAGVRRRVRSGGGVFVEFGCGQGAAVRELLAAAGEWKRLETRQDLAGRERFAVALA